MLSFLPEGIPRSIGEYFVAHIPGSILLFAFFLAAELAVIYVKVDTIAAAFIPVICIMPLISGLVSTLVLEKLRSKPLTFQRGALAGALACLAGSSLSAMMLLVVQLVLHKAPLGGLVGGLLFYAALVAIVVIDTILGALGGVLLVKFIKDI
jgi:hypothetical protein